MDGTYRKWLPGEIRHCAAADRASVDVALISGETSTSTVTPVTANLRALAFTGDKTDDRRLINKRIDRLVRQADNAILDAPPQQLGTDIIGLICVAHDLLHGYSPATLIIDSDGINNRQPYILAKVPLDAATITADVGQMKASGQLCSLAGTKIFVYGAGIGIGTNGLSAERLAEIHRFWQAVFSAAGAKLVAYQRNP